MIESKDNQQIKYIKKLQTKKYRDEYNEFLIFGEHLIEEAEKHGEIVKIYTTNHEKKGLLISKNLMKELNFTKTAFDRLAIVKKVNKEINSNKVLILEDIQDPTNVGALLRSAAAFGFKKVIISDKTADIYNERCIRASQGSIFHLSVLRTNIYKEIEKLKANGYSIIVADLNEENEINYTNKLAIVLGNEGSGVTDQVRELADALVTIKTETVESLNVSVAGSILMYEWSLRWK